MRLGQEHYWIRTNAYHTPIFTARVFFTWVEHGNLLKQLVNGTRVSSIKEAADRV